MKRVFAILLCSVSLFANAWEPTKPINVYVPSAAGAFIEMNFRLVAKIVEKNNPGVSFIIENRPGADGVISTNALLSAPADGYTISSVSDMSTFVTQDIFQREIKKYNHESFTLPLMLSRSPLAIVARMDSKINTPKEFINLMKTTNQPVNVAVGGGPHKLSYDYIMDTVGNNPNVKSIAFQGPLPAVTAVASDSQIEFGIMPLAVAYPLIEGKKVKLIGITGDAKLEALPDVPLAKDAGVPGLALVSAGATLALPPNTPKDIVEWYSREFSKAIQSPEGRAIYRDKFLNIKKTDLTPEGVKEHIASSRKMWAPYINGPKRDYN
jgi:tripartite-type tricarboxylate transporter receptor subunit TctC